MRVSNFYNGKMSHDIALNIFSEISTTSYLIHADAGNCRNVFITL